MADAANANLARIMQINAQAGRSVQLCYVKNSTATAIRAWEVIAGHVPLYAYDANNPGEFRRQLVVTGRWPTITPGTAAASINDHYHPVVVVNRINSGDIGLAVMSGLTPAKVSIGSEAHPCVALDFAQSDNATLTATGTVRFKTASHGYRIVAKTNGNSMFVVDLGHPQGLCWQSKNSSGYLSGAYTTVNPWSTIDYNSGELIRRQLTSPERGYFRQPGMYRVDYAGTFAVTYTLNGTASGLLKTTSSKDLGAANSIAMNDATGFGQTKYFTVSGWYLEEVLDTSAAYIELQYAWGSSSGAISVAVGDLRVLVTKMA